MRHRPYHPGWLLPAVLLATLGARGLQAAQIEPPPPTRTQVGLIGELERPGQAGGEIVLFAAADGTPRAGRRARPPAHAGEERARRAEHFALARKVNVVTWARLPPQGLPLETEQIELLERFAMSDVGAVWFREVADDTLRLFNQGYLEYDSALWQRALVAGETPRLSELISGLLSETGQFAQDAAPFRLFAYDGTGAMAAAASVRLGTRGFRCRFPVSGELVDPLAVLSHEFGHTRYGDPRSAGQPLGEALTVARYENPVRVRNGFPPRVVYYLRVDPGRVPIVRELPGNGATPASNPVWGWYCECQGEPVTLRPCPEPHADGLPLTAEETCVLRWLAVRVDDPHHGVSFRRRRRSRLS